ncbi:MAG: DinB family protein [Gemmatimonadetes bacterium]|nr:DinB family protein [Gemmatimonadota bacterium]
MKRVHPEIRLLLFYLDQAFGRRGWHGPTLSAAVRNLPVPVALWRPAAGRHNIWELVLHTAYWKYAVRRRLTRDAASRFSRPGADWPRLPAEPTARQWESDIILLKDEHRRLVEVVEAFQPSRLHTRIPGTRFVPVEQIQGIAAHDLYHCGQISLVQRLYEAR